MPSWVVRRWSNICTWYIHRSTMLFSLHYDIDLLRFFFWAGSVSTSLASQTSHLNTASFYYLRDLSSFSLLSTLFVLSFPQFHFIAFQLFLRFSTISFKFRLCELVFQVLNLFFRFDFDFLLCFWELDLQICRLIRSLAKAIRARFLGGYIPASFFGSWTCKVAGCKDLGRRSFARGF